MNGADPGLSLADALCARLCHDLSSPLGTLMGALEMIADDADAAAEALPLARDVAAELVGRLRLFRAAWSGDCGPLSAAQLADLAAGLPGQVRAELDGLRGGCFPAATARVLVNLLLLGGEALPRGGVVTLSGEPGGDVVATIKGPSAAWPAALAACLVGGAPALDDPRRVQAPLVVLLARAAGLRLSLLLAPGAPVSAPPLLLTPAPAS